MFESKFTISTLKEYLSGPDPFRIIKFVKVEGEYRFTPSDPYTGLQHSQLVEKGETPEAAGIISVSELGEVSMLDNYSMTLNLHSYYEHVEEIAKALGLKAVKNLYW